MSDFPRIAIAGKMGSGKTTSARFMQKCIAEYGEIAYVLSFSTKIKQLAKELFYNKKTEYHKDRKLLQDLGQKMREINENVWIDYLVRKIETIKAPIIIDDVRFREEFNILQKLGFTLIRLNVEPEVQKQRLKDSYPNNWEEHIERKYNTSETDLDQYITYFDHVLDTNNTDQLNNCLKKIISGLINDTELRNTQ